MNLSKRLETVASFVPGGSNLADIGTDHGYVPIFLAEQGRIGRALAMDVRKGPLMRAEEHIRAHGLADRIDVRLSDGLEKLAPGEADCVVIAGMGGELMIHILEEGRHMWNSVRYWVLSPHSELDKVRRFLERESFSIVRETMIKEEGKYYTVMGITSPQPEVTEQSEKQEDEKCDGGGKKCGFKKETYEAKKESAYRYGKILIEQKNPVLLEYLKKEEATLRQIADSLALKQTPASAARYEEIRKELEWNKEAQNEMQ